MESYLEYKIIPKIVIDICRIRGIIKNVNDICQKLKGGINMPGRDGTGPLGIGARTGRGLGCCVVSDQYNAGLGLGLGCGRGFGRGNRYYAIPASGTESSKELLQAQKELLERRLDIVNKQLEKN